MKTAPSLKNSLTHWSRFPKLESAFAPRLTRVAANLVTKRLENVQPQQPSYYDLETLYKKVLESWKRHASIDRLLPRDLQRLPWVLFYSPQDNRHGRQNRYHVKDRPTDWLDVKRTELGIRSPQSDNRSQQNRTTEWVSVKRAELGIDHRVNPQQSERQSDPAGCLGAELEIVRQYNCWLSANHRPRAVLSLLHEFLRVYPVDLTTFEDLRWLLKNSIEDSTFPPPSLLKWKQRCLEYGFLEEHGSLSFVKKLISANSDLEESLTRAGLDGGLARCGFLESGIRKYLPAVSRLLAQDGLDVSHMDRVITLLECEGKLRFHERSVRMVIAYELLRPFVDRPARTETKKRLQSFFLRHYGHPSLRSGKHKWSGVSEDIRRVVIRWLVERALDQFFLLVKETALDRHWKYREAFWKAFLDRDMIEDVCFVLGPRAEYSRWNISRNDDATETAGILHGAQGHQSVLLLRMPGVTVAEWSHNGKCRFWLDGNQNAPKLYRSSYSRYDLTRGEDFGQAHHGSDRGSWQDRIAQWMRENTGASLEREEYTLKQLETSPKQTKQPQIPWRKPTWRKRQVRWRR